jgi:hypothetical protein
LSAGADDLSVIRKSGHRFSEEVTLKKEG